MLTIQKASAGSGKTFQLARQYLVMLLGVALPDKGLYTLRRVDSEAADNIYTPNAHSRILAVTFTNKATAEMTQRIVKELAILAVPDAESDHRQFLLKVFTRGAAEKGEPAPSLSDLAKTARRALRDLLFNFSAFNVMTIDSFFQMVIQTFARELDLTPNTRLEIDNDDAIAASVAQLMELINRPPSSTDHDARLRHHYLVGWLARYIASKQEDGANPDIFNRAGDTYTSLLADIGHMFSETYRLHHQEIDAYLQDPERVEKLQQALSSQNSAQLLNTIKNAAKEFLAHCNSSKINTNLAKWIVGWSSGSIDTTVLIKPTFFKGYNDPSAWFPPSKRPAPADVEVWHPQLCSLADLVKEYAEQAQLAEKLGKQAFYLGIFGQVLRQLIQYRRENDTMMLSDTGSMLRTIINGSDTPFIYERLGLKLDHYLIDEFQDTSLLQWDNFEPLVSNSMAQGLDCLIIGDEKQSIYRFRNAHPELLGHIVADHMADTFGSDSVDIHGALPGENTNWRSAPLIVRFNNEMFHLLAAGFDASIDSSAQSHPVADVYANVRQEVSDKMRDVPGFITAQFTTLGKESTSNQSDSPMHSGVSEDEYVRGMFDALAQNIDRQLKDGYHPCDIAILTAKNKDGARVIQYLMELFQQPLWTKKHGVTTVMSVDALTLGASSAVKQIVAMLQSIAQAQLATPNFSSDRARLDPEKQQGWLERERMRLLFSMCLAQSDPDTGELNSPSRALALAVAASHADDKTQIDASISRHFQNLQRLAHMAAPSLTTLVQRIILEYIPETSRQSQKAFIAAFVDMVADYSESHSATIADFLEFWLSTGVNTRIETAMSPNAIIVSSIHKAKGLEYPCVHIPFIEEKVPSAQSEYQWLKIDPDLLPASFRNKIDPEVIPPYMPLQLTSVNPDAYPRVIAAQVRRLKTQRILDTLNKYYVAFTRAQRELSLYGPDTKLGGTVLEAMLQVGDLFPDQFSLTQAPGAHQLLTLGHPTEPIKEKEEKAPFKNVDLQLSETFNLWERPATELRVAVERKCALPFDISRDRDLGIFLHEVLRHTLRPADLPRAFARAAATFGVDPDLAQQKYLPLLQEALAAPDVAPFFRDFSSVATERDITVPQSDDPACLHPLRRADRLVWMPDGRLVVIDYKFGDDSPRAIKAYTNQVRRYMRYISLTGTDLIQGLIFFPLSGKTVPVTL